MKYAKQIIWSIVGTLITGLAFAGWQIRGYVADELVHKSAFVVVKAQAETALDEQMEILIARIAQLDAKRPKTADDHAQLKYLRDQLDRLRKIRTIK